MKHFGPEGKEGVLSSFRYIKFEIFLRFLSLLKGILHCCLRLFWAAPLVSFLGAGSLLLAWLIVGNLVFTQSVPHPAPFLPVRIIPLPALQLKEKEPHLLAEEQITEIQKALIALGYGPLTVDGIVGRETKNAITRFEKDRDLPLSENPTPLLLEYLYDSLEEE